MSDDIEDLFEAIYYGDAKECTRIVRAGADVRARLESSDPDRWSVLHVAANRLQLDIARILLDEGADPNAKDRRDDTPLHVAASKGDRYLPEWDVESIVGICGLLIERGADPNTINDAGQTPLFAAARKRPEVCRILIESGADPTVRNDEGLLPEDETDDEDIRLMLRAAREARELGTATRPVEELQPSRRGRLGRPTTDDRTDEA